MIVKQFLVLILASFCVLPAHAQIIEEPDIPVRYPNAGCYSCRPDDTHANCRAKLLACIRVDSAPYVTPGQLTRQFSAEVDCNTCQPRCPCCPVLLGLGHSEGDCLECWRVPSEQCLFAVSICHTQSQSFVISPTLELELGISQLASIKTTLALAIGQGTDLTRCFEATCGWPLVGPCIHRKKEPYIEFDANATATIDHTWSASGVWETRPGSSDPCAIAGNVWTVDVCKTGSSSLTGSVYARGSCGDGTIVLECP